MLIMTIRFSGSTDEATEVHLLNVGDIFEGFGGSRHQLVAGHDFNTGKRHKKPTASLILRRRSRMGCEDVERDIHDPQFWSWIARIINGEIGGITAETNPLNINQPVKVA